MRGTAPLLVALISVLFLGDSLSSMARVIAVICMAILGMACNGRASSQRGRAGINPTPVYCRDMRWWTGPA